MPNQAGPSKKISNLGFCIFGILKASSQFLFAYFQNGGKRVKTKQKVAYLGNFCFDFDDVYIKFSSFLGC